MLNEICLRDPQKIHVVTVFGEPDKPGKPNKPKETIMKAAEILAERRCKWQSKKILRKLYHKWYSQIGEWIRPGVVLELGGGSGNLKEHFPDAVSSDIVFAPWLDAVLDAHRLPFRSETFDDIVLFDVLHHLSAPVLFFREAERVLKPGGRVVLMEPYVSWGSYFVYRFLHAEGMQWLVDPFETNITRKDAFQGNQAIPRIIFEKERERFECSFPDFTFLEERRLETLLYPLSGGFHNPSLLPITLYRPLELIESVLKPLNRYLAYRIFIVLEKGTRRLEEPCA